MPSVPSCPYVSGILRLYDFDDSSDRNMLSVPRMSLALTSQAFSVSAPTTWNSLSDHCKDVELFSTYSRRLKTELFNIVYHTRLMALCKFVLI